MGDRLNNREVVSASESAQDAFLGFKQQDEHSVDVLIYSVVVIFLFAFVFFIFKKNILMLIKKRFFNLSFFDVKTKKEKKSIRLSPKTVIHIVDFDGEKFLIAESTANIVVKDLVGNTMDETKIKNDKFSSNKDAV